MLHRPGCSGRDQPQSHSWQWLGQKVALGGEDQYDHNRIYNSEYWWIMLGALSSNLQLNGDLPQSHVITVSVTRM